MVSAVSGRRVGDVTAIALLSFITSIAPAIIAGSGGGLFRSATWARAGYLVPAALGWALLTGGMTLGFILLWRARQTGGSLGVPDWAALTAASCSLCTVGFIMEASAFGVLTAAALQLRMNGWVVALIATTVTFLTMAALYAGYHAIQAIRDEGDDVVEFEIPDIKAQRARDKEDKYWSADDDEIEESGNGLQY